MTYNRPILANRPQQAGNTQRPNPPANPRPVVNQGGGNHGNNGGARNGNGGNQEVPSPWLLGSSPEKIDKSASFVEYLRWMRSLDQSPNYKDATKTQILQMAQEGVNYQERLKVLNQRTEKIANARHGVHFKVMCPWRMRVGGHRGPESILLPSFDALGVPYLPSSTLTGVARAAAIREFMERDNLSWQNAEKKIAPYFGSIEVPDPKNRAGKVIFLDAYPEACKSAGLAMDMANSIWRWEGDRIGDYSPNPNPFFSLKDVTFVVGVCRMASCDDEAFDKVKAWLIKGLQSGVGSQINSGYGEGLIAGKGVGQKPFFEVNFELEGQLIHGAQKFENVKQPFQKDRDGQLKTDNRGNLKPNQKAVAEVRAIAFKSMLRYWFRAIARGLMSAQNAKILESRVFGAIDPQSRGWLTVRVHNPKTIRDVPQRNNGDVGLQSGTLALYCSSECPVEQQEDVKNLAKSLTWLMFSLGGVGQGARRPCYSRANRQYAPWYRGSQIYVLDKDEFWKSPETMQDFQNLFRNHLQNFCSTLSNIFGQNLNLRTLQPVEEPRRDSWHEALDLNCRILLCAGNKVNGKAYGLSVLHGDEFKRNGDYNPDLCGSVRGHVKPSPVWVNDQGDDDGGYQVVTIFGVSNQDDNPRYRYLQKLQTDRNNFLQIFPLA
jgi:CRISPR-associated protein Cmr6